MNSILQPAVFMGMAVLILGGGIVLFLTSLKDEKQQGSSLKQLHAEKDDIQQQLKASREELTNVKSELALRNQMFEGLKGQYAELEKDYEKMVQKEQQKAPEAIAKPPLPAVPGPSQASTVQAPNATPPQEKTDSQSPTIRLI